MPFQKGYIPWIKGKRKEEYPQLSNAGSPIGTIPWNRGLHPKYMQGENHPMYKDGLSKTKEGTARYSKEYRHRKGISKKYMSEYTGFSKTKEAKRLYRKRYKYNLKQAGELSIKTIQMVYEDNIKKFGTLTCYLCLNPIDFGKDHLEHKIPVSRNGTNEYSNLAIACQKCNCKKHNKTEEEFRKENF